MGLPARLLWGEGLFLRPQHFQQQDQYHEARLHHTAQALHPYLWGIQALQIDAGALKANTLRLQALSIIFRDGEVVDAPGSDPLPPAIDLASIPASVQELTFFAALPSLSHERSNFTPSTQNGGNTRFVQADRATPDMFTRALDAELSYLKKSVRLMSDLEPRGAFECLPLLRLRRTVSGEFELDAALIPPCVSMASSPRLKTMMEQLMDALQAKIHSLQGHMREPRKNVIELRSGDVSAFWLLHTASTASAALMHYLRHPSLHPERVFEAMLGLAGSLMSYSRLYHLANLPVYDHMTPGPCFAALDGIIRDLLDTVISSRYFSIAVSEDRPCYHSGKLDSGRIDQSTMLYLAISANMPALELVEIVPLRVKVGAPDDVEQCVLTAMPGVKLMHAPQVPSAIPVRPDTCYFALDAKGMLYEQMLKAQSICIYVPAGIRELRLELIGVAA
ncbi:type VI secretion system baseplate subunit TssK [Massilia sp. MB5]|uniref:type VI secretion system baseplate subunit TssK n=1 Tax=Massilia sp. MB5 TaxID=2919578 RepID=UPI001F0D56C7|nr:type VI secretion system baseplate subunit TssK [Massilia sp. MB5]UMR30419.1 type VI secretion system baseplate subunit TssK [Massilia sp. MB5]